MVTLENLDYPTGKTFTMEYVYSNQEEFKQHLFEKFTRMLGIDYGCGYLIKGVLYDMTDDKEYYTYKLQGDKIRKVEVYFVPYEEEDLITIEWKYLHIKYLQRDVMDVFDSIDDSLE